MLASGASTWQTLVIKATAVLNKYQVQVSENGFSPVGKKDVGHESLDTLTLMGHFILQSLNNNHTRTNLLALFLLNYSDLVKTNFLYKFTSLSRTYPLS